MMRSTSLSLLGRDKAVRYFDTVSLFRLWPSASLIKETENAEFLSLYSELTKKSKTALLGYIGRAYCFINSGNYESALQDIKAIHNLDRKTKISFESTRFVKALHARARQGMAFVAAAKNNSSNIHISKSCSYGQEYISTLQNAIDADAQDFSLTLALGEDLLDHAPETAIGALNRSGVLISRSLSQCSIVTAPFCLPSRGIGATLYMNMWLSSMSKECTPVTMFGKSLKEFVDSSKDHTEAIAQYSESIGSPDITPIELHALLTIQTAIEVKDHGFTRPCRVNNIPSKNWDSKKAQAFEHKMANFGGDITANNKAVLDDIHMKIESLGTADTAGCAQDMPHLNSITKEGFLENKMGKKGVQIRKTHSDPEGELDTLLRTIDTACDNIPTTDVHSSKFEEAQRELLCDLLKQQQYRSQLAVGIAKARSGNEQEGVQILADVIESDAFLPMHKVFTARANALQWMGETDRSDADFREAFRLKISAKDIPSVDANAQRRSF